MRAVSIISLGSALLALWAIGCDSRPAITRGPAGLLQVILLHPYADRVTRANR